MAATPPLIFAARAGDVDRVRQLIADRADLNVVDDFGRTPLIWASVKGHRKITELLVAAGADIDKANMNGLTSMIYASRYGHREIAELLVAAGADLEKPDKDGWTPLIWASSNGRREITELLVAAGADIDKAKMDGWTSLIYVSLKGHREIAELLVAAGADLEKADKDGWTPLIWASEKGHREVALMLLANGAQPTNKARSHARRHPGVLELFTSPLPTIEAEAARQRVRAARERLEEMRRARTAPPAPAPAPALTPVPAPAPAPTSSSRDTILVDLLTRLKVSPALQNKLFDEEDLEMDTVKYFTKEMLESFGLSKVRSSQLFDEFQKLLSTSSTPTSPFPPPPTALVASSSAIPQLNASDLEKVAPIPNAIGATAWIWKGRYGEEEVAIKVFKSSYIDSNHALLLQEASVWASLSHNPHIARLYGLYKSPQGEVCLVMELCELSLRARLNGEMPPGLVMAPLTNALKLSYAKQIALALRFLHSHHVVHRDLKAANVLLTNQGRTVKLADFGWAHPLKDQSGHSILVSFLAGTPGYLAPELLQADDHKYRLAMTIDIFALAVTFLEILDPTGFRGINYPEGTTLDYIRADCKRLFEDGWRPTLPQLAPSQVFELRLVGLIEKCWHQTPELRPNAWQVVEALEKIDRQCFRPTLEEFLVCSPDRSEAT